MKKILQNAALPCAILTCAVMALFVMLFSGCPEGDTTITFHKLPEPDIGSASLAGSVYAGEGPSGWVTVSFRESQATGHEQAMGEHVAVIAYDHDNTTAVWDFLYHKETRVGTGFYNGRHSDGSAASGQPGAYEISENGQELTFFGFGATVLQLVRDTELTVIDPIPFSFGGNAVNLVDTVWAGHTPIPGAWLTISFQQDDRVIMSFSHDNSSNAWEYSWDNANFEGNINTGIPWIISPKGFNINGNTLSITNFGNHNPDANPPAVHYFHRYR